MDANLIQKITIFAIPLIFAITLHEAAHAFAARYFGDSKDYMLGRMTLNPLKHIDPIWTIVVPLLTLMFSGMIFGAAKPVPVNFGALRRPKQDMIWVAAAGPLPPEFATIAVPPMSMPGRSPGPIFSACTRGARRAISASAVSSPTATATEIAMQRSPAEP